ncbi:unnamed protein product [Sphagnum troendelagicum]|uniref:Uncharacterized protein n=1 Tax=Sphagnum troendelagicum TaxID=128251 RepID=A0ABP0UWY6_9BRYO
MDDEDFHHKIHDDPHTQHGVAETTEKVLTVWFGQRMEWRGNRRQLKEHAEHRGCRLEIKHWHISDPHHLFMIDLVTATDSGEEATPSTELLDVVEDEDLEVDHGKQRHWKDQVRYYNKRQQLELVLAAQGLSEVRGSEINLTIVDEEDKCGGEMKCPDIWQDTTCLMFLREGMLPEMIEVEEGKRARKRAMSYVGRNRSSSSRTSTCPCLKKEDHYCYRCMRIWDIRVNRGT